MLYPIIRKDGLPIFQSRRSGYLDWPLYKHLAVQ